MFKSGAVAANITYKINITFALLQNFFSFQFDYVSRGNLISSKCLLPRLTKRFIFADLHGNFVCVVFGKSYASYFKRTTSLCRLAFFCCWKTMVILSLLTWCRLGLVKPFVIVFHYFSYLILIFKWVVKTCD